MTTLRGKTAVIPWPEVKIGLETVEADERFGQAVINDWGATRRAFLSSCMKDRQWLETDSCEDIDSTFYGRIQQSNKRMV